MLGNDLGRRGQQQHGRRPILCRLIIAARGAKVEGGPGTVPVTDPRRARIGAEPRPRRAGETEKKAEQDRERRNRPLPPSRFLMGEQV